MDSLKARLNLDYLRMRWSEDWPSLLILAALLVISTAAISVSEWADGLWILPTIAVIALVVGYLLAISIFSEISMILIGLCYAIFVVWSLVADVLLPQDFALRHSMTELARRIAVWIEGVVVEGGFSRDSVIFVTALAAVVWLLAFNAATNLFRSRRLWYAVIPPGIALLINAYYYFGPKRMDFFLIAYLFLAFVLAVRTNAVTRERAWRRKRVGFTPGVRMDFLRAGTIAIVIVIALAWSAPAASASNRLSEVWDKSINPWHRVQDTFQRLFGGVRGGSTVTADYYGGATLSLGGPINLSNATVMYVFAPQNYHYYWRSKVFDTYSANGQWASNADSRQSSEFGRLDLDESTVYALRENVQQRFELTINASRLVYSAPQPVSFASLPVTYDVISSQEGSDAFVDVTQIRSQDLLVAGDSYSAISSMSFADETSLRTAGTDYPDWVAARYLQLPNTITDRTFELAISVTAPYDNPYDRARAIEHYLRETMSYNQLVPPIPSGREPVDYFLFESKEGYCTYYASAMVVMLRALGIPSRVAAGFAQGEYDARLGAYRVAESDAHSWVEVYFPNYGWVEFEPTASIDPILRQTTPPDVIEGPESEREDLLDPGAFNREGDPLADDFTVDPAANASDLSLYEDEPFRIPAWFWWGLSTIVVAVGAFLGAWFYVEQRGLTGMTEISRSYARLNIYAPWMGIRLDESSTPAERARVLGQHLPTGEFKINQITHLYMREQYAPPPQETVEHEKANAFARQAWETLRPIFIKASTLRWLKRFAPSRRPDFTIKLK